MSSTGGGRAERGVSEVVGIVLLFGLVLAGATLILAASNTIQNDIREQNRLEAAQNAMVELDDRLGSLSYASDVTVTSIDFPDTSQGRVRVVEDATTVTVTLNDGNRGNYPSHGADACSAEISMGAVKYVDDEGGSVAYSAGGVWRESRNGQTTMVSPPSIRYSSQTQTMTLEAPVVSGRVTATDDIRVSKDRAGSIDATDEFERNLLTPREQTSYDSSRLDADATPCVPRENVTVTVETPYTAAWADYLGTQFDSVSRTGTDEVEASLAASSLPNFDSDGDGTVDGEDNCPYTYNPTQSDVDGDGLGGACDSDDDGDDVPDRDAPRTFDADGNYASDGQFFGPDGDDEDDDLVDPDSPPATTVEVDRDNCQKVENENQADRDDDGVGQKCDGDSDGDGLPGPASARPGEPVDNCVFAYNPNQTDTDDDGIGDACDRQDDFDGQVRTATAEPQDPWASKGDEPPFGGPDDEDPYPWDDSDGPGKNDEYDNCPYHDNTEQNDNDDDGFGNVCDVDDDNDGFWDTVRQSESEGDPNSTVVVIPNVSESEGLPDRLDLWNETAINPNTDEPGAPARHPARMAADPGLTYFAENLTDVGYLPDGVELRDDDGNFQWLGPDNCPGTYNPSQNDSDDDGVGNACEGLVSSSDDDGDGINNNVDPCPQVAADASFTPTGAGDASHRDLDSGGRGDVCDVDADGDGVRDYTSLDTSASPPWSGAEPVDNCRWRQVATADPTSDVWRPAGTTYISLHDALYNPAGENETNGTNTDRELDSIAGDEFGDSCDTDDDNDGTPDPWHVSGPGDLCPKVRPSGGSHDDADGDGIGDACDNSGLPIADGVATPDRLEIRDVGTAGFPYVAVVVEPDAGNDQLPTRGEAWRVFEDENNRTAINVTRLDGGGSLPPTGTDAGDSADDAGERIDVVFAVEDGPGNFQDDLGLSGGADVNALDDSLSNYDVEYGLVTFDDGGATVAEQVGAGSGNLQSTFSSALNGNGGGGPPGSSTPESANLAALEAAANDSKMGFRADSQRVVVHVGRSATPTDPAYNVSEVADAYGRDVTLYSSSPSNDSVVAPSGRTFENATKVRQVVDAVDGVWNNSSAATPSQTLAFYEDAFADQGDGYLLLYESCLPRTDSSGDVVVGTYDGNPDRLKRSATADYPVPSSADDDGCNLHEPPTSSDRQTDGRTITYSGDNNLTDSLVRDRVAPAVDAGGDEETFGDRRFFPSCDNRDTPTLSDRSIRREVQQDEADGTLYDPDEGYTLTRRGLVAPNGDRYDANDDPGEEATFATGTTATTITTPEFQVGGCYPSRLPNWDPGPVPPEPRTSAISIRIDLIELDDD
jgi:hypothetical protein